jgi:large conductance mechanosensitive channel
MGGRIQKFVAEFKAFAFRGNVIDLAVGVIIGASFQGVVSSLTENVLAPIIGLFANQNFNELNLHILGVELRYGAFLTSVINFVIMALIVFLMIKLMNKARGPLPKQNTHKCPYCYSIINENASRCPHCTSQLTGKVND